MLILFFLLHFQINAQIGFDKYGMYIGKEEYVKELIVSLIQNNATKFNFKVTYLRTDGSTKNLKYKYSFRDSILHQSCAELSNMHIITKYGLKWIPNIEDTAEYNPYGRNRYSIIRDSNMVEIYEQYKISNKDSNLTFRMETHFDSLKRITKQFRTSTEYANNIEKTEFVYYENDSIIELEYHLINKEWRPYSKLKTIHSVDKKIIEEYNLVTKTLFSITTFTYKSGVIQNLQIDIKKKVENSKIREIRMVIEPQRIKYRISK